MYPIGSIASSGMAVAARRAEVAAENIVNMRSTTAAQTNPVTASLAAAAYQPKKVEQTSVAAGGVRARVVTVSPSHYTAFDPSDPSANADGLVSVPNIDLGEQLVQLQSATHAYRANAAMLRTADEMAETLLDIKS